MRRHSNLFLFTVSRRIFFQYLIYYLPYSCFFFINIVSYQIGGTHSLPDEVIGFGVYDVNKQGSFGGARNRRAVSTIPVRIPVPPISEIVIVNIYSLIFLGKNTDQQIGFIGFG